MLGGIEAGDLTAFTVGEHGPVGAAHEAGAVRAELTMLKEWFGEVAPGSVGRL